MSRCISTSLMGFPRIRALPAVGKISLIRSLMAVDLPAPLGPINPNTSPVSTCMFKPSSDVLFLRFKNPKGYTLVKFSVSIAASRMSLLLASRASPSIAQQKNVHGEKIERRKHLKYEVAKIRSRRGPARFAPAPLVALPAASSASASGFAGLASYPISPPAARTKPCTVARKTSWSSTPGGASPACTAPAESPDTRAAVSTSAPARLHKCISSATPSGTAHDVPARAPQYVHAHYNTIHTASPHP